MINGVTDVMHMHNYAVTEDADVAKRSAIYLQMSLVIIYKTSVPTIFAELLLNLKYILLKNLRI